MTGRVKELHPKTCGFCEVPLDTLMERIEVDPPPAAAEIEFRKLPAGARFARIREAQEIEWWKELPRPG